VIIPGLVLVEDDSCTKTTSWVDTGSCNWDCGQVHQEHSEPNWQRCQNLTIHIFIIIRCHENEVINQLPGSFYLVRKRREMESLQGHGSLWHSAWHPWQRRQCRQEQKCQQSQHQGHHLWCNQD